MVVVEGKHGRRSTYLPKETQARLRKLRDDEEEDRRVRDSVAAYQKGMQGDVEPYELTAENMRNQDRSGRRRSASYVSGSRSHRSSASQGGGGGGIKIESGGTTLHVYGDAKVALRGGENGEPASIVIGSGGAGDTGGGGSRSSRSGRGRPKAIREENSFDDGYEVGR
jgi:hypothetical protein